MNKIEEKYVPKELQEKWEMLKERFPHIMEYLINDTELREINSEEDFYPAMLFIKRHEEELITAARDAVKEFALKGKRESVINHLKFIEERKEIIFVIDELTTGTRHYSVAEKEREMQPEKEKKKEKTLTKEEGKELLINLYEVYIKLTEKLQNPKSKEEDKLLVKLRWIVSMLIAQLENGNTDRRLKELIQRLLRLIAQLENGYIDLKELEKIIKEIQNLKKDNEVEL